jgi:hypothetical protein
MCFPQRIPRGAVPRDLNSKPRGPAAQRVSKNIRALRWERGLDLADLSKRLGNLGQPIAVSGLSKLELGQRRVDVDDLVALALALDVTPNRLLLTEDASDDRVVLVGGGRCSTRSAWRWHGAGRAEMSH